MVMKMNLKIFAVIVAAFMLAVPFAATIGDADESDAASGEAGLMNVYVNTGTSWSGQTVLAYNGCQALESTTYYQSGDSISDDYTVNIGWWTINSDYGTITELSDVPNGAVDTWHVLVYVNGSWSDGIDAIGWYKPFNDYLSSYATANIALWFGEDSDRSSVVSGLGTYTANTLGTRSLTSVSYTSGSVYEHIFYIEGDGATVAANSTFTTWTPSGGYTYNDNTIGADEIEDGVYFVGYGSDAELALIDALNGSNFTNVTFYSSSSPVPGYLTYGWLDSLFDLETEYENGVYYYWNLYTYYDEANLYFVSANFVVGAYSALTNAPLVDGTLSYKYVES
jgi:hypothetical protein